jgi:iron(III) transport system permease protein
MSLSWKNLKPNLSYIHPSWIEAAQLCGAKKWQRLVRIYFPLLKSSLLACSILIFMPTFSELTMTLLLSGPQSSTLGVLLFELQEYADRSSAAVVGTLILILVLILERFTYRKNSYAQTH